MMLVISYDYPLHQNRPDWSAAEKAHAEEWLKAILTKSGLVEKARNEQVDGHAEVLCEIPVGA